MYGGAGKLRRSGGGGYGGGRKRSGKPLSSSFRHQTPPLHRLSGGPRSRAATSTAPAPTAAPSMGAEESFSLVRGNPLNFGMIIRLAPNLVDEIRWAKEHGMAARIKFDANPNNPSGNVIDVGGKNFKFTWSFEVGNLCDIYEECQGGEDGNSLLVESGCTWRKLNVQRVLDESTKNHVKKRSEEAERQQKSRKAIILDPGNPSTKNQMNALTAAESAPWRKPFQQKKEPEFKKRKIDTPPVAIGSLAKSVYKSGLPSTTTVAGRPSISSSPPRQSGAPASLFITGSMTKGHMSAGDLLSSQAMVKENVISLEKGKFSNPTSSSLVEKPGRKGDVTAKSVDLQGRLITLLKENPKGMSLKGLEKAVGDSIPNSLKIEPIIKKIATFQAPRRYILKPGVELGSSKKPLSENGSCPDDNGQQTPVEEKREYTITLTPNFAQTNSTMILEKPAMLNPNFGQEMNSFDNVDILHQSVDLFGEKMVSNNTKGPACSSSDNGSASDSDNSDSRNDSVSKSRSRSKSPVRSRSRSSSDSESDASSSSKQGYDEDVDIMTSDDGNSKPKPQLSEPEFSAFPIPLRAFEAGYVQNVFEEMQNAHGSDIVEIEPNMPDDIHQARMAVVDSDTNIHTEYMSSERKNIASDVSKHDRSRNPEEMSKCKSKRGSDSKPSHQKFGHAKRLKSGNLLQPQLSWPRDTVISESPHTMPYDRIFEEADKGCSSELINRALKDGSASSVVRKGDDCQKSWRRPSDHNGWARASEAAERPQETTGAKGLENKGCFEETENRPSSSDYWNTDLSKGRPAVQAVVPSKIGIPLKRNLEYQTEDLARPPTRVFQSQPKSSLHTSMADQAEVGIRKSGEVSGKQNRENRENCVDGLGDAHMNISLSGSEQHDVGRGQVFHPKGESKTRKSNSFPDPGEVKKDASLTSNEGVIKRRESSSDENCSFSKYEKEEPALKGPIKDISQYKEYVQEYREKYDSYCLLNMTLESYRNEFYNLGKDLENAKERDVEKYYQILEQLLESYRQCGNRHKRMKKIFIVLHEELKHLKQEIQKFVDSYARK